MGMHAPWKEVVERERAGILLAWQDEALGLFSEKMAPGTPMAEALGDAMGLILDDLVSSENEATQDGLERLMRIFAVHPFPPSRSLSVFRGLELIVREAGHGLVNDEELRECIDRLTLQAFDRFMEQREKIYRLKVEEERGKMHMLLRGGRS